MPGHQPHLQHAGREFLRAQLSYGFLLSSLGCGGESGHPDAAVSVCGDGIVEAGESCDDGNTTDGDGCSATCRAEGLLQKCGAGLPGCPATAPVCVGLVVGGTTYCTPKCLAGGTGSTDASGAFGATTPPRDEAICAAQYHATIGQPVCQVVLATNPADRPIEPNKVYAGVDLGCAVACGAGRACPAGTTCDPTFGPGACLPD